MSVTIRCKNEKCAWTGPPQECPPSMGIYHDFTCPKCGTSALDTSELCADWASRGETYIYGDDNFLHLDEETKQKLAGNQ